MFCNEIFRLMKELDVTPEELGEEVGCTNLEIDYLISIDPGYLTLGEKAFLRETIHKIHDRKKEVI